MPPESSSPLTSMRALTIAGFDPSGAAGVLADVRTFNALGLAASAVITSITFQNLSRGFGAVHQTVESVRSQLDPLFDDLTFSCVKTGMLPTREIVSEVARLFRETKLPRPVIDPVMLSSAGQRLMEESAADEFIRELLPLARLITPNVPEAETLTGTRITSETEMLIAAARLREMGARAVLIKGGHLGDASDREAIDVLDDEGRVTVFREAWVPNGGIRGSGCILSASIAAGLGKGMGLEASVAEAKSFVLKAIRTSV